MRGLYAQCNASCGCDVVASMAFAHAASAGLCFVLQLSQAEEAKSSKQENQPDLSSILLTLATNFLLYVVLIVVFVMLVHFYLEDDYPQNDPGYTSVPTHDSEVELVEDMPDNQLEMDDGRQENAMDDLDFNEEIPASSVSMSHPPLRRSHSNPSFLDFTSWDEPAVTKEEAVQRLMACGLGLTVCFVTWGLLQERMLTQPYDGEYFTYSYGLVFTNRLQALILSAFLMYYSNIPWPRLSSTQLYEFAFPSVSNMLSSWCQYEALRYVTFPTQVLSKSFKILPTMLMGKVLHEKHYEAWEYGVATMIAFGIWLFIDSTENLQLGVNVTGDLGGQKGAICGLFLLLAYLFFDSFTGQYQTRMFIRDKSINPVAMMLMINAFSTLFSFITLVHTEELTPAIKFMFDHPQIHVHFLLFSVCSTVGQVFIFYTMKNFGAVVFAIIMTIRILLSIVFSCLIYDHPIAELDYVGMFVVFLAVGYRIQRKTEGNNACSLVVFGCLV